IRALEAIGIAVPGAPIYAPGLLDSIAVDTLSMATDTTGRAPGQIRVFGLEFFERSPWELPVSEVMGPVDRDYRLGPGDQLYLFLTGDVELAYTLNVTREGMVIIPEVGQMSVNG